MYTTAQIAHNKKLTQQLLNDKNLLQTSLYKTLKDIAQELRQIINYHDWRYYVLAQPTIKDIDYDYLFDALKKL